MCYFSLKIATRNVRDAKEGEDVFVSHVDNHAVLKGADDKIVCVKPGTLLQVENLKLNRTFAYDAHRYHDSNMKEVAFYNGKPVTARLEEWRHRGEAADCLALLDGYGNIVGRVHLSWIERHTKGYLGAKRASLIEKLGLDKAPALEPELEYAD